MSAARTLELLFAIAWLASSRGSAESPVVTLKNGGALRGYSILRNNQTIFAFEGIPYARPPVGERRFKDPEEVEPWDGERNATSYGSECVQLNVILKLVHGDEDCLFINVYTTSPPDSWESSKKPVVVWFHGGAFLMGSGNMDRSRPDLILKQGLVFVSLNYRLGAMGFLNTEDSRIPGNAGLKDMVLALKWVKDNIAAFGGDPEEVSIFGVSAGGAAVHYLTISPLASGLFKRALAMSGSALSPWAFIEGPRTAVERLAARINCSSGEDLVPCLRAADAGELVTSRPPPDEQQVILPFWKEALVPSVEAPGSSPAPFLPAKPDVLMKDTSVAAVPYMTGITDNEGVVFFIFSNGLEKGPEGWETLDETFEEAFIDELPPQIRTRENLRRLREFYLGDRKVADAHKDPEAMRRFLELMTDLHFGEGSVRAAVAAANKGAPVYFYEFSYYSPNMDLMKALYAKFSNVSQVTGVAHGNDLAFIFDFGLNDIGADAVIVNRHVELVSNFLKTGNPTPEGSPHLMWPQFTVENQTYAEINKDLIYDDHKVTDRIAFWKELQSSDESKSDPQEDIGSTTLSTATA